MENQFSARWGDKILRFGSIKAEEREDLNCAVKEYLILAGYSLTATNFNEEVLRNNKSDEIYIFLKRHFCLKSNCSANLSYMTFDDLSSHEEGIIEASTGISMHPSAWSHL